MTDTAFEPARVRAFRFTGCSFDAALGEARLGYAFDDLPELAPFLPDEEFQRVLAESLAGEASLETFELVARVHAATGREPLAFTDGPEPVRTIGIVSGAGADHLEDAIAADLDAFVTRVHAEAVEAFLAAGTGAAAGSADGPPAIHRGRQRPHHNAGR